ncbi:MAG: glycosyltransferase [Erysipelotrichaceae bacterium]|nr:glycosyltransferase [Erysipelotrichaceae bacterium]
MPKISVIVPIYKVENYLNECVDSVLAQTFTDFELILIDDGSPDNCGKMCDEYAKKDKRIVVIHQLNRGLSAARNTGLDVAKGKYITFIDSDDFVSTDYLEILYKGLVENNADASICKHLKFSNLKKEYSEKKNGYSVCSGRSAVQSIYNNFEISITAWAKLYKAELFNYIRFPDGRIHEDQAVIPIVLYNCKCIACLDNELYFFRVRSSSITHSTFNVKRYDNILAVDDCISFFEEKKDFELVAAAKKQKKILLCCYSIEAKKAGIYNNVPKKYKVNELKALLYIKNNLSDKQFTYYLAKNHSNLILPHEYIRKIKKVLGLNVRP